MVEAATKKLVGNNRGFLKHFFGKRVLVNEDELGGWKRRKVTMRM